MTALSEEQLLMLENLPNKMIKRRINRELERFITDCSLISIDSDTDDKKNNSTITILDHTNNLIYSMILDPNYPFRAPKVQINFRPYYDFLKISSSKFTESLKKIHNIRCLCCSTITCGDKWSPALTTSRIIEEIRRFKGYKRDLINKLLADKIKFRYLIDDIDLDSWLF